MFRPRVQYLDVWAHYSNSGHPFLISSNNLHDKVTKRSGRHDPSMVIIRHQAFQLWTCRSISHAITRVHVLFTFLLLTDILLALFFPSVLLSSLSLFRSLSVCLCVCFHAIPCNILLVLFMFHHVSCKSFHFLACSFHLLFYLLSASVSLQALHSRLPHINLHVSATSSIFGCLGTLF